MLRLVAALVLLVALAACQSTAAPSGPVAAPAPPQAQQERATPMEVLRQCLGRPGQDVAPVAPADAASQVAEIAARVGRLRALPGADELVPEFVSLREIATRVARQVEEDYPAAEAEADRRVLAALGAVPRDIDLRATVAALLSGRVIGYFDTDTEELVVAVSDRSGALDATSQSALAHEITHAITDAAFGLPDDAIDGPSDAGLAAIALAEGDAVLTQERFARSAISFDQQLAQLEDPALAAVLGESDEIPHVLRAELRFPYVEGAAFACSLTLAGGLDRLNAAYDRLPTTTAQILFPDRYLSGEGATDPRDPGQLGLPWRRDRVDTLGAAELMWLFEAPGDDPAAALADPLGAAAGLAGGEIALWIDGPRTALGVALVDRGVGELCDAVSDWYEVAFPDDEPIDTAAGEVLVRDGDAQDAVLRCGDQEVRLGIAPDLATARALAA